LLRPLNGLLDANPLGALLRLGDGHGALDGISPRELGLHWLIVEVVLIFQRVFDEPNLQVVGLWR
jgi:hypothetical protein